MKLDAAPILAALEREIGELPTLLPEDIRQLADRARDPAQLRRWLKLRLAGEPLAHICGQFEFYGLSFYLDKRAYVTDPELTHLVAAVEAAARSFTVTQGRAPLIAEVGVGCGSLSLSLGHRLPAATVVGIDLDSGQLVLAHIYRDFPILAVEAVLETLTITGRLAGPEATLAALRSGTPTERSYAIETVEQFCDRSVFNLLLPLIDGRSLEAQIEHGARHGLLPHLTSEQVLERAAESHFPLQASAVAQANYHRFGSSRPEVLFETLRATPDTMVHRTVMALLAPPAASPPVTPVDVTQSIMSAAPLKGALFIHHETLLENVEVIEPAHDQVLFDTGTPSDGLWHIMSGRVRLSDSAIAAGPSTTLGQEEFHTGCPYRRRATALAGSRIVHLTKSALEHTVRIHPTFGLVLLRQKLRS